MGDEAVAASIWGIEQATVVWIASAKAFDGDDPEQFFQKQYNANGIQKIHIDDIMKNFYSVSSTKLLLKRHKVNSNNKCWIYDMAQSIGLILYKVMIYLLIE